MRRNKFRYTRAIRSNNIRKADKAIISANTSVEKKNYGDNIYGVVVLRVTAENLLPFEEWLTENVDNYSELTEEEIDELFIDQYSKDLQKAFDSIAKQVNNAVDEFNNRLDALTLRFENDNLFAAKYRSKAMYTVVIKSKNFYSKDMDMSDPEVEAEIRRVNNFLTKLGSKFDSFEINRDNAIKTLNFTLAK